MKESEKDVKLESWGTKLYIESRYNDFGNAIKMIAQVIQIKLNEVGATKSFPCNGRMDIAVCSARLETSIYFIYLVLSQ